VTGDGGRPVLNDHSFGEAGEILAAVHLATAAVMTTRQGRSRRARLEIPLLEFAGAAGRIKSLVASGPERAETRHRSSATLFATAALFL
jgi:hypothetical protein